jgi:hypothetical protein
MPKKDPVSMTNTKAEILNAYQMLLTKKQDEKKEDPKIEKKEKVQAETVAKTEDLSSKSIITEVSGLKLEISQSLDALEAQLLSEFQGLSDLRQTIKIKEQEIKDLYEIEVCAESLWALVKSQQERQDSFENKMEDNKVRFDTEMAEQREKWKREKDEFTTETKERDLLLRKERSRETEEYGYQLKITRSKEEDEYQEKRLKLERELEEKKTLVHKDLAERQELLVEREKELAGLKKQVEGFSPELEKLRKSTEKDITEKLEYKYQFERELSAKQEDGERLLAEQKIDALTSKIKEQDAYIKLLSQRSDTAGKQVQDIAMRAIDGASGLQQVVVKSLETPKQEEKKSTAN